MTASLTNHLVSVWNPAYASDAMDATVELLRTAAQQFRAGEREEDAVYVWWGKVRSSNRQQPLAHLADVVALDEQLRRDDGSSPEMHLYLTDYQSLYVGHVGQITTDDVLEDDGEFVPEYYRSHKLSCDCWFQLWDIRRVIADDTPGVIEELRKVRNTRYHDRPVSIYGGMVELPLIVTRSDGARYFEPDVRTQLTDGKFWVEFDAERVGSGPMERELRDNLFGELAWNELDPAARSFIATAERIFRDHRNDPGFDLGSVIVNFAKAFEVQVNTLLRNALAGLPARDRYVNVDGQSMDVAGGSLWSLGTLATIIGGDQTINAALRRALRNGDWFATSLPPILKEVSNLRNAAAHTGRVSKEETVRLRNQLVGVGATGALVELGRVRPTR